MAKKTKPNYQAWEIDENDFPKNGTTEDKIRFLIGYGILAPSTHNTQPWKLEYRKERLIIIPEFSKALQYGDPQNIGLYISLGAFIENILKAAEAFKIKTKLSIDNKKAEITFGNESSTGLIYDKDQLYLIKKRASNKFLYTGQISPEIIRKLSITNSSTSTCEVKLITDKNGRSNIIKLHLAAAGKYTNDKKFVRELASWLRLNGTNKNDGMPGFVTGNSAIQSAVGKGLISIFNKIPVKFLEKEQKLMQSSSAFVIFGSKKDSPAEIIKMGMIIERFWLNVTALGIVGHPLFAIISSEEHKNKLKNSVGMKTIPLFFMRLGKATVEARHTPRYN